MEKVKFTQIAVSISERECVLIGLTKEGDTYMQISGTNNKGEKVVGWKKQSMEIVT